MPPPRDVRANGRELADRARRPTRPELKVPPTTGYSRNAAVDNGVADPRVRLVRKPRTARELTRTPSSTDCHRCANATVLAVPTRWP